MNMTQAVQISKLAKAKGYAVSACAGKVQFQTVEFDSKGISTVIPRTEFMDYESAMQILEQ